MKKISKILALVLVMALLSCCMLMAGCGAKKEGVYKFYSMSYEDEGMSVEIKVGEQYMGMLTLSEDFMVITLNADGTASVAATAMGESGSGIGTWTDDDKESITITIDGEAKVCFCDGKTLIIEDETIGEKITFKKSK